MKCYICTADENWASLKELHKEKELLVCKTCGNVAFRVEENEEEKVRNYYRYEYRPAPGHGNLITTTHKQNYVLNFLKDFLKDKKELIIGDVGCATGYLVSFFRKMGHKATGCEYTLTYRRFAEHFYGVPITEELREDLQYDFITIYHVLEHMVKPDEKLNKYRSLLKDGGHMLISTPKWYENLEEASGPPIKSFEELWHKNHINVFSKKSINNLFKRIGFQVVKEDHFVYGQTYLLKKADPVELKQEDYEKADDVIANTHKAKKAIDLFLNRQFKEAVELWPAFPDAWVSLIMDIYGKDSEKQDDLWKEVFAIMPHNKKLKTIYSCVYLYQRQRYQEAIDLVNELMQVCPDEEKLMILGQCHALINKHQESMQYFYQASEMNPTRWQIAMDFLGKEASLIPTWDERALQEISDKVKAEAKKEIKLIDPLFDKNGKEQHKELVTNENKS